MAIKGQKKSLYTKLPNILGTIVDCVQLLLVRLRLQGER